MAYRPAANRNASGNYQSISMRSQRNPALDFTDGRRGEKVPPRHAQNEGDLL